MDWNMARHADGSDIFVKSHLESLEGKHKFASDSSARNSISLKKVFNQKINKIKKIGQPLLLFFFFCWLPKFFFFFFFAFFMYPCAYFYFFQFCFFKPTNTFFYSCLWFFLFVGKKRLPSCSRNRRFTTKATARLDVGRLKTMSRTCSVRCRRGFFFFFLNQKPSFVPSFFFFFNRNFKNKKKKRWNEKAVMVQADATEHAPISEKEFSTLNVTPSLNTTTVWHQINLRICPLEIASTYVKKKKSFCCVCVCA